jgi:hypothetical protein
MNTRANNLPARENKIYTIKRSDSPVVPGQGWNSTQWQAADTGSLDFYMGGKPAFMPTVNFRLLYDESNIYVIFKVKDRFIKACRRDYHSDVCKDSCVEFFFTPGADTSQGYFNLEMNCIGTLLFYHQKRRDTDKVEVDVKDCRKIKPVSSLSAPIEDEIRRDLTWFVEYSLPLSILPAYAPFEKPGKGVEWRANFYKCGDETSNPHYLTWSKVDLPGPDFHQPDFFGKIIFD